MSTGLPSVSGNIFGYLDGRAIERTVGVLVRTEQHHVLEQAKFRSLTHLVDQGILHFGSVAHRELQEGIAFLQFFEDPHAGIDQRAGAVQEADVGTRESDEGVHLAVQRLQVL